MVFFIILVAITVAFIVICVKAAKQKKKMELVKIEEAYEETKRSGGLGRAAVGGALFGGAGAIVGAVTAKESTYKTYKYHYDNGVVLTKRVKVGSLEHKTVLNEIAALEAGKEL